MEKPMTKVQEALLKIQSELDVPKGQFNAFGKYHYRSCEDILQAVKPLLDKHGVVLNLSDELVNIGERYYIKATAFLTDGNDVLEVYGYAREEETKKGMDGSQITGASSSYARKYALNGLFLIDDNKDSDTTNTHGTTPSQAKLEQKPIPIADYESGAVCRQCGSNNLEIKTAGPKAKRPGAKYAYCVTKGEFSHYIEEEPEITDDELEEMTYEQHLQDIKRD